MYRSFLRRFDMFELLKLHGITLPTSNSVEIMRRQDDNDTDIIKSMNDGVNSCHTLEEGSHQEATVLSREL